ncbi:MAG: prepilin peptidase [Ruminococcus sp.]|nr:prepilin peptidase [Ruminococcus sp.]
MTVETLETMMNVTIYVFVFLFGITIGSFLNVCILRLPKGESLVKRNSHCMTCGTEIKRYDLIPVFSWLILRGKCRACGAKISPRYMLIESLTGVVFLCIFFRYTVWDWGFYPVLLCLFAAGLIVLCFQDIDNREMCVSVLVYTFAVAVVTNVLNALGVIQCPIENIADGLLGMVSVSLVFFLFGFVLTPLFYNNFVDENRTELKNIRRQMKNIKEGSREYKKLNDKRLSLEKAVSEEAPVYGFGMGDIVLMAAGGLMLGLKPAVTAGFAAVIIGAVYGIVRKITSKDDSQDANVFAFGPFIIIGLFIAVFAGSAPLDLYLAMLTPAA